MNKLEELDALVKAATPGPWSSAPAVPGAKRCFYIAGNNDAHNRQVDIGTVEGGYYSCEANAALIVWLVNNAPAMLRAQAEEIARLREWHESLLQFVTRMVWFKPDMSDREIIEAIRFRPDVKARRDQWGRIAEDIGDDHTLTKLAQVEASRAALGSPPDA